MHKKRIWSSSSKVFNGIYDPFFDVRKIDDFFKVFTFYRAIIPTTNSTATIKREKKITQYNGKSMQFIVYFMSIIYKLLGPRSNATNRIVLYLCRIVQKQLNHLVRPATLSSMQRHIPLIRTRTPIDSDEQEKPNLLKL